MEWHWTWIIIVVLVMLIAAVETGRLLQERRHLDTLDYEGSRARQVVYMIERITAQTAATVTFLPENEEGTGPDNTAVEVNAEWTEWKDRRYYGMTHHAALSSAFNDMLASQSE